MYKQVKSAKNRARDVGYSSLDGGVDGEHKHVSFVVIAIIFAMLDDIFFGNIWLGSGHQVASCRQPGNH